MFVNSFSEKVKEIHSHVYQPPKAHICPELHLPMEYFCVDRNSKSYLQLKCKDPEQKHEMLNYRKIVPQLSKWVQSVWEQMQAQGRQIEKDWKICETNINYCIDILRELINLIHKRKHYDFPIFDTFLNTIRAMQQETNVENLLQLFDTLQKRFQIYQTPLVLNGEAVNHEIHTKHQKWRNCANKAKKFSEKALLFSQVLAEEIQQRLKHQQWAKKAKKNFEEQIVSLKDIMHKNIEQVRELKIQLSSFQEQKQKQCENINEQIQKCWNLKTVYLNNKNGHIKSKLWQRIFDKFEHLKKLTCLKLNIRAEDAKLLNSLFRSRPNTVRHINELHLTITDEPKLETKDVSEVCNSLQLHNLNLTLTRDNLTKAKFETLLRDLRLVTSLSHLPLSAFFINVSKNSITSLKDEQACKNIFHTRTENIRKKTLLI